MKILNDNRRQTRVSQNFLLWKLNGSSLLFRHRSSIHKLNMTCKFGSRFCSPPCAHITVKMRIYVGLLTSACVFYRHRTMVLRTNQVLAARRTSMYNIRSFDVQYTERHRELRPVPGIRAVCLSGREVQRRSHISRTFSISNKKCADCVKMRTYCGTTKERLVLFLSELQKAANRKFKGRQWYF